MKTRVAMLSTGFAINRNAMNDTKYTDRIQRERERERERQAGRQTDRQTDRQRQADTDRQTQTDKTEKEC